MTVDQIIDDVLETEGSTYTNDPADPGGPTRWGITQRALASWRGHPVSPDDVRALERSEAVDIYRVDYVEEPRFHKIHDLVRPFVVDTGVNMGQRTAAKMFQKAVGAKVDGRIGPKTIRRAKSLDPMDLLCELIRLREDAYVRQVRASVIAHETELRRIVAKAPTLKACRTSIAAVRTVGKGTKLRFLRGWVSRPLGFLP